MELFRQGDPEAATQDVMLMFKAMIPILKVYFPTFVIHRTIEPKTKSIQ